jgi:hypothetical protein
VLAGAVGLVVVPVCRGAAREVGAAVRAAAAPPAP